MRVRSDKCETSKVSDLAKLVKLLTSLGSDSYHQTVLDCSEDVSPTTLGAAGSFGCLLGLPCCRLHLCLVIPCHCLSSKGGQQVWEDYENMTRPYSTSLLLAFDWLAFAAPARRSHGFISDSKRIGGFDSKSWYFTVLEMEGRKWDYF